ncbi:MAG TPA: polyphenol oxidase family protein [Acidimicrobiales bacterium]|nr:polyphenol oxidase family protein [Acidimicrobiales bacterium]
MTTSTYLHSSNNPRVAIPNGVGTEPEISEEFRLDRLEPIQIGASGGIAKFTDRKFGDARAWLMEQEPNSSKILWVKQVHGSQIVLANASTRSGEAGDALVTADRVRIGVMVADCLPIALSSHEGVVAAVHCGWRGLVAGVIPKTLQVMQSLGCVDVEAAVGACIGPECYEFGEVELRMVEATLRNSGEVRSLTSNGVLSLDLKAAALAQLHFLGVSIAWNDIRCTACSGEFFSARMNGDSGRQSLIVCHTSPLFG